MHSSAQPSQAVLRSICEFKQLLGTSVRRTYTSGAAGPVHTFFTAHWQRALPAHPTLACWSASNLLAAVVTSGTSNTSQLAAPKQGWGALLSLNGPRVSPPAAVSVNISAATQPAGTHKQQHQHPTSARGGQQPAL